MGSATRGLWQAAAYSAMERKHRQQLQQGVLLAKQAFAGYFERYHTGIRGLFVLLLMQYKRALTYYKSMTDVVGPYAVVEINFGEVLEVLVQLNQMFTLSGNPFIAWLWYQWLSNDDMQYYEVRKSGVLEDNKTVLWIYAWLLAFNCTSAALITIWPNVAVRLEKRRAERQIAQDPENNVDGTEMSRTTMWRVGSDLDLLKSIARAHSVAKAASKFRKPSRMTSAQASSASETQASFIRALRAKQSERQVDEEQGKKAQQGTEDVDNDDMDIDHYDMSKMNVVSILAIERAKHMPPALRLMLLDLITEMAYIMLSSWVLLLRSRGVRASVLPQTVSEFISLLLPMFNFSYRVPNLWRKTLYSVWKQRCISRSMRRRIAMMKKEQPKSFQMSIWLQLVLFLMAVSFSVWLVAFTGAKIHQHDNSSDCQDRRVWYLCVSTEIKSDRVYSLGKTPCLCSSPDLYLKWQHAETLTEAEVSFTLKRVSEHFVGVDFLSMADMNLSYIPPEVSLFPYLYSLFATGNRLTDIPPFISNMTNLYGLYLSKNQLTDIPESLANLVNMQSFAIGHNQVKHIPGVLFPSWPLVFNLYLNHNPLMGGLPREMEQLEHLRQVLLGNLNLTNDRLPDLSRSATSLVVVGLEGNPITQVPEWVVRANNLTNLDLSNTLIEALPKGLRYHQQLNTLELDGSPFCCLVLEVGAACAPDANGIIDTELCQMPLQHVDRVNLDGWKDSPVVPNLPVLPGCRDWLFAQMLDPAVMQSYTRTFDDSLNSQIKGWSNQCPIQGGIWPVPTSGAVKRMMGVQVDHDGNVSPVPGSVYDVCTGNSRACECVQGVNTLLASLGISVFWDGPKSAACSSLVTVFFLTPGEKRPYGVDGSAWAQLGWETCPAGEAAVTGYKTKSIMSFFSEDAPVWQTKFGCNDCPVRNAYGPQADPCPANPCQCLGPLMSYGTLCNLWATDPSNEPNRKSCCRAAELFTQAGCDCVGYCTATCLSSLSLVRASCPDYNVTSSAPPAPPSSSPCNADSTRCPQLLLSFGSVCSLVSTDPTQLRPCCIAAAEFIAADCYCDASLCTAANGCQGGLDIVATTCPPLGFSNTTTPAPSAPGCAADAATCTPLLMPFGLQCSAAQSDPTKLPACCLAAADFIAAGCYCDATLCTASSGCQAGLATVAAACPPLGFSNTTTPAPSPPPTPAPTAACAADAATCGPLLVSFGGQCAAAQSDPTQLPACCLAAADFIAASCYCDNTLCTAANGCVTGLNTVAAACPPLGFSNATTPAPTPPATPAPTAACAANAATCGPLLVSFGGQCAAAQSDPTQLPACCLAAADFIAASCYCDNTLCTAANGCVTGLNTVAAACPPLGFSNTTTPAPTPPPTACSGDAATCGPLLLPFGVSCTAAQADPTQLPACCLAAADFIAASCYCDNTLCTAANGCQSGLATVATACPALGFSNVTTGS